MALFPSQETLQSSFDPHSQKKRISTSSSAYWISAPMEPKKPIQLYSPEYYAACATGGLLATGSTHAAITPLDLVKTRRQVDAKLYKSNFQGWKSIIAKEGLGGIFTGFGATLVGYSLQGAGKYGFYEIFKKKFSDFVGEEAAVKYKTGVFLVASASAEFLADILLCPWEAVKVKTQATIPPYANNLFSGLRKFVATEGYRGLYKGITPLWLRQIPYTMVKFSTFENIVVAIYSYLPKNKEDYSTLAQTGVSFLGGYIAGVFCALVSHPADVMVSKVNAERTASESMGTAVKRIYAQIGFGGLWNGLGVRIVMIGTLTGLQWLGYDSFKVAVGLPTTGGGSKK